MASTTDIARIALEEKPRYQFAPETGDYQVSTDVYDLPIQSMSANPAPSMLDRSDEMRATEGGPKMVIDTFEPGGSIGMRAYANPLTWLLEAGGFTGVRQAGGGTDELQTLTITGVPTGGSFTVTWTAPGGSPKTTGAIPYNATAKQVRKALEEQWGPGNFICAGGPLPGVAVTIKFAGIYAAKVIALMTTTDSLTGGTAPASAIAETTPGAAGATLDPDGNGVTTGASLWTFNKRGGITAKTLRVLLGYLDENIFLRGSGYGVASLGLNADGALTADLAGLVVERISDPNITPALDASTILPARRGDLYLSWLAGGGSVNDFSMTVTNPLVRNRTLSLAQSSNFPDRLEHGDEKVRLTGSIPMHSASAVDFDALMDGDTFAATARWKMLGNNIGSTGTPYGIWVIMPACQYLAGGIDPMANRRRFGGSFDFWASHDDGAGYDVRIVLANSITAITTGITA